MKKIIFFLPALLFAQYTHGADFKHAVGIGLQYGGLIGYELSNSFDHGRIKGAVEVIGASVGYEHFMTDSLGIGLTLTPFFIRPVYSLNLNYWPAGHQNNGWMFGLDLGHMPDTDGEGFLSTDGAKNIVLFSAGYRF